LLRWTLVSGQAETIAEQLAHPASDLQTQLSSFQSSDKVGEVREMNLMLVDIFERARREKEAQKYRLLFLQSIASQPSKNDWNDVAAQCIKSELSSSTLSAVQTLLNLKAVQNLAKSNNPVHTNAYRLLTIFGSEDVKAFNAFVQENKNFLDQFGLSKKETLSKIRTLTLCNLALSGEYVSYAKLIEILHANDDDEVETVIIEAVKSGRIEAKIDQEGRQVLIERISPRVFTQQSWKQLADKVQRWKTDVAHVIGVLQQAQFNPNHPLQQQSSDR